MSFTDFLPFFENYPLPADVLCLPGHDRYSLSLFLPQAPPSATPPAVQGLQLADPTSWDASAP